MAKVQHEIKDAIHEFIRVDSFEREVVDSEPLQRLRHINQLSLSNLVYPGATHRRFEHSLGVMELASRVYDSIITEDKLSDKKIRDLLPDAANPTRRHQWRSILRMAALCHDIGHLPLSHALEKKLLPKKWDHERLTYKLIMSKEMEQYWNELKLLPKDIARIAVGPSKAAAYGDEKPFST
ncbi:MAG: HD domain-containing protein, partial [candidate division Zixibacteria bacterium]|nr:HD domain-containing protein [candidate division Zixibacteria bacterium]